MMMHEDLTRLASASVTVNSRKITVVIGLAIIFLVILDLLVTRQVLPYTTDVETTLFIATVVVGYGFGSWILLGYTRRVSEEIRAKSRFINVLHWTVTLTQFTLFGILLIILFSGTKTGFLASSVFAISSALATFIMGVIAFKFFTWYKLSYSKNFTILFYGFAALTLALSIAEDASTKLLMVQVVYEDTPEGVSTGSSFLYEASEKYSGEIIRKEVNGDTTTLLILPDSNKEYYNLLNSTVLPIAFVFRWIASTMLLRNSYQKIGKLSLFFWIILSLPLILYLVGKMPGFFSGESLSGVDEPYRYFFRILFRTGTIAGNILFGLAFFMVARKMSSSKLRDYLILTGIGDTIVGIALSTSALEPTYGVAGHSLVLLSSYLFSIGFYLSAISLSQDSSLRKSIRKSMVDVIDNIGTAQMEQQLRARILKIVQKEKQTLEEETGGVSQEVSETELREYMDLVTEERKHSTFFGGK
jgi:hypothetical protein